MEIRIAHLIVWATDEFNIYIYIYIYVCVCVCVCARVFARESADLSSTVDDKVCIKPNFESLAGCNIRSFSWWWTSVWKSEFSFY